MTRRQKEFRDLARQMEQAARILGRGRTPRQVCRTARKMARQAIEDAPVVRIGPSPEYEVVWPEGARA